MGIAVLILFVTPANSQQSVNIIVLPFEVFAQKDLSYLQSEIPSALKNALEKAGAKVALLDAASEPQWRQRTTNVDELKKLARQSGAGRGGGRP